MRISDWSSDVCSSDLRTAAYGSPPPRRRRARERDRAPKRRNRRRRAEAAPASPAIRGCDAASSSDWRRRSEEHTSELQSLMRISYAVFCLKKKTNYTTKPQHATYVCTDHIQLAKNSQ